MINCHLGFSPKSSYFHGLKAHSTQRLEYFKAHFPGISPTDLHLQVQEHVNKGNHRLGSHVLLLLCSMPLEGLRRAPY